MQVQQPMANDRNRWNSAGGARASRWWALGVLVGIAAGCGSDGVPLVPVEGRVTFAGGPPPATGMIMFSPTAVDDGLPRRPGRAQFDEQGFFQVSSFQANDGLVPGRYRANITCWQGTPSSGDPSSFERLNYVPQDYRPPELVVDESAGTVDARYDIPRKK